MRDDTRTPGAEQFACLIGAYERSKMTTLPAPDGPEAQRESRTIPPPGRIRFALGLSFAESLPAWPDVEVLSPH